MARQTVAVIMQHIGGTVNQDASVPTDGGADSTLWLNFLNRAQIEWAEVWDWEELRKVFYPTILGTTNLTIPLPLDFRKLSAPVLNYSYGISDGQPWEEVPADRIQFKNLQADRFFTVTGEPFGGYFLQWYPNPLESGASGGIPYYSTPTSLASQSTMPACPNSEFLAQRVIAYILESRSDPRYQDEEIKARNMLNQMVENSQLMKFSSYVNPINIITREQRRSFRIGRN